ncbi:dihydrolipoyl dehydrogenase [Amphibacillus indicireducens]|uniref:Dihydrolipoyl dehydrogenase n=1 Tax=Amphibacillus indicireducens TaxID=1076330 RepID=A0ABP7VF51_9BACI
MSENYDLVILGGGMGGYIAAIRARQLGLSVALVEKELIGGTCLHKGCIPTKTLLKSASFYQDVLNSQQYGIETSNPVLHFAKIQARKEDVVNQLYRGLQHLMKHNKINIFNGYGRLLGPSIFSPMAGAISVEHEGEQENTILIGKHVLLATGTVANQLDLLPFDGKFILSSDDALRLEKLPESIAIIGGGVIGVEWASMLNDFGVNVTLIENQTQLLPSFDQEIAKQLAKDLKTKGINVLTNNTVINHRIISNQAVELELTDKKEKQTIITDQVLVAIGRSANLADIGISNTSITTDSAGFIDVNKYYQTKEDHIYAVGDCIGGEQLAHVAAHEGKLAVEHMVGQLDKFQQQAFVPSCVYSQPEVATVGLSEAEASDQGLNIKVKKLPFSAIGKALVNGDNSGFVKMIIDQDTKDLLGVHMIGNQVTELIAETSLAMLLDATAAEIGYSIHPHPSLSEAIQEVALAIDDQPVHSL